MKTINELVLVVLTFPLMFCTKKYNNYVEKIYFTLETQENATPHENTLKNKIFYDVDQSRIFLTILFFRKKENERREEKNEKTLLFTI